MYFVRQLNGCPFIIYYDDQSGVVLFTLFAGFDQYYCYTDASCFKSHSVDNPISVVKGAKFEQGHNNTIVLTYPAETTDYRVELKLQKINHSAHIMTITRFQQENTIKQLKSELRNIHFIMNMHTVNKTMRGLFKKTTIVTPVISSSSCLKPEFEFNDSFPIAFRINSKILNGKFSMIDENKIVTVFCGRGDLGNSESLYVLCKNFKMFRYEPDSKCGMFILCTELSGTQELTNELIYFLSQTFNNSTNGVGSLYYCDVNKLFAFIVKYMQIYNLTKQVYMTN